MLNIADKTKKKIAFIACILMLVTLVSFTLVGCEKNGAEESEQSESVADTSAKDSTGESGKTFDSVDENGDIVVDFSDL